MKIIPGDCLAAMREMESEAFDACVTDPPYGLSFMGKDWDHGIPGVPFWSELLRVLKPGAHLLAFGGTRTFHRLTCAIEDAGFEVRDCLTWLHGQGFPKSKNVGQGWGTALKPAWEPIILARKPLAGTVAENVQRYGTGALNVAASRIGAGEDKGEWPITRRRHADVTYTLQPVKTDKSTGRWPANVVLDEDAARLLDEQSGTLQSGTMRTTPRANRGGFSGPMPSLALGHAGDSGGASRFFYCAKASSSERHMHGRNNHPTVKPVDLMRWLCRLVTPPGGLILDPFMGSGSTGVAALAEGFSFVGCELNPEYVNMACKRVLGPLFAEAVG